MSGGHFDYAEGRLEDEMFGIGLSYDLDGNKDYSAEARRRNPLMDKDLSELAYDLLCLIHSFDYYIEDDTSEETYRKDTAFFKNKWMKQPNL